jgi:hypothetical protein
MEEALYRIVHEVSAGSLPLPTINPPDPLSSFYYEVHGPGQQRKMYHFRQGKRWRRFAPIKGPVDYKLFRTTDGQAQLFRLVPKRILTLINQHTGRKNNA